VTSSVASSTSTTASPDPRLRRTTSTATLCLFSRALRARPATEHYRSLPGNPVPDPCRQPSPCEVPQDSPRRVYGPFRHLAPQHGEFLAQDKQLEVLRARRPAGEEQEPEDLA
jgi:hypothetical protein